MIGPEGTSHDRISPDPDFRHPPRPPPPTLTEIFIGVSEHIDATRPDLVVNSGDLAFDGPTSRDDLEFARTLHDALPVPCRYLPGNHDIGDNPTEVGPAPSHTASDAMLKTYRTMFGEDRWR